MNKIFKIPGAAVSVMYAKASSHWPEGPVSSMIRFVKRELGLSNSSGKRIILIAWPVFISKMINLGGHTLMKLSRESITPESKTQSRLQRSLLILYTLIKPEQLYWPTPAACHDQSGKAWKIVGKFWSMVLSYGFQSWSNCRHCFVFEALTNGVVEKCELAWPTLIEIFTIVELFAHVRKMNESFRFV